MLSVPDFCTFSPCWFYTPSNIVLVHFFLSFFFFCSSCSNLSQGGVAGSTQGTGNKKDVNSEPRFNLYMEEETRTGLRTNASRTACCLLRLSVQNCLQFCTEVSSGWPAQKHRSEEGRVSCVSTPNLSTCKAWQPKAILSGCAARKRIHTRWFDVIFLNFALYTCNRSLEASLLKETADVSRDTFSLVNWFASKKLHKDPPVPIHSTFEDSNTERESRLIVAGLRRFLAPADFSEAVLFFLISWFQKMPNFTNIFMPKRATPKYWKENPSTGEIAEKMMWPACLAAAMCPEGNDKFLVWYHFRGKQNCSHNPDYQVSEGNGQKKDQK